MSTPPVSGLLTPVLTAIVRTATIQNNMFRGLLFIACIFVMLLILAAAFTAMGPFRHKETRIGAYALYAAVALVLVIGAFSYWIFANFSAGL